MISIIIPAYNVEDSIEKTLNSIIHQTYTDWEVIVVNDGSTDNTEDVLKQYSYRDKRIKYKTILNSGAAHYPRLEAASIARGEYICNVDADDYIEPCYLEKLYSKLVESGADVVCAKMLYMYSGMKQHSIPHDDFNFMQVLSGKDAAFLTFKKGAGSFIATNGMLCKKKQYDELVNNRHCSPNYIYQDEIDCLHILLSASKVAFSPAEYYYVMNVESVTHKVTAKKYDKLITEIEYKNIIVNNYTEQEKITAANNRLMGVLVGRRLKFIKEKDSFSNKEKNEIEQNFKIAFRNIERFATSGRQRYLISFGYSFFCLFTYIISLLKK